MLRILGLPGLRLHGKQRTGYIFPANKIHLFSAQGACMENKIQDPHPAEVSDEELLKVIADFLEMGYVENIVAMFKQESLYYEWVGELIKDERFAVRLGVSVLFEYLVEDCPDKIDLAIPSLAQALQHQQARVRGEALSVLAIIATDKALDQVKTMTKDPDPEIADLAREIMTESEQ